MENIYNKIDMENMRKQARKEGYYVGFLLGLILMDIATICIILWITLH